MALTDAEKIQVRHHLGYPNVQPQTAMYYGAPTPVLTAFKLEGNMEKIIAGAEDLVRKLLAYLEQLEERLHATSESAVASAVDEVTINQRAQDQLWKLYRLTARRLGDLLMVEPLWTSQVGRSAGISVPRVVG